MTIQVPFRLRRRPGTEPVAALFVPSLEPGAVLACCARLGLDPSGRIFDVAGGFLLELARPAADRAPGAIRLRALAPALYIPVDSELLPSLLADEANGLVRDWGLVFLPGGRALVFDRNVPVPLSRLLNAPVRRGQAWRSLPEPGHLADRVVQIALEPPELPPEALYREFQSKASGRGGHDATTEGGDPSGPAQAGAGAAGGGAAGLSAGGWALPAGALVVLAGMVQSLRAMFGQAGATVMGLKQKAQWEWVDHSALLKKLVHEFREGDPALALRRAVPLTDPGEPVAPTTAPDLPWSRAVYNLGDLLSRRRRGELTPVLPAQTALVQALAREYRKAAERATERGDFRRAAYIYGVLLRDDRMAARALERGGLHHDAATLYLKKLNDPGAAAQAFEAAGAVDRAVVLYRQLGRHESAGDLLRRLGDEEAAIAEYERAAALLVASRTADYLAAGRLLLEKARRPDRAIEQFRAGWHLRPQGNAVMCALEMARIHAQRGAIEPIRTLLDQADALFETPGKPFDGFFYNEMARLAALPSMEPAADELRDRALQSLAQKLRADAAAGQAALPLVSAMLGRPRLWPAALVSDAEFAATAEVARSRGRASTGRRDPRVAGVRIGRGIVTAACQARATSELFLGFDSGIVLAYRPSRDEIVKVAEDLGSISALALDPEGTTVVALHRSHRQAVMSCFRKLPDGTFRSRAEARIATSPDCWLTPILPWGVERLVGFFDGQDLVIVDAASGMLWQRRQICADDGVAPRGAILVPVSSSDRPVVFTHDGPFWVGVAADGSRLPPCPYRWQPAAPVSSSLRTVPISWRFAAPLLELLGLDKNGAVHGARFHAEDGWFELVSAQFATTKGGYLAAALMGPSTVVAVATGWIDWLVDGADERFRVINTLDLGVPTAVACFAVPSTREALVVCSDGFVARVTAPGRARRTQ
jgi:tetratricopeptide (TPR) repeat protein